MGITNMYPNLPGHLVEFKDGGLQLTTGPEDTEGFKKSLLILGTALDGPINEPVKIDSKTVTQLFGSDVNSNGYPNGATLTKYAKQAFSHGFTDVRCMRVTGTEATAKVPVVTDNGETVSEYRFPELPSPGIEIEGHPKFEIQLETSALPLTSDTDDGSGKDVSRILFHHVAQDGSAGNAFDVANMSYSRETGKITVEANQVDKNATFYVSCHKQSIHGKDTGVEANGNTLPQFKTKVVKGGSDVDTETAPIDTSTYDPDNDPAITFDLVCENDEHLYAQPYYTPYGSTTESPLDVDISGYCPYPKMYKAVHEAMGGSSNTSFSEDDAKNLANGLNLIIVCTYSYNDVNQGTKNETVVLSKNDFSITETTDTSGNKKKTVTINKPTISVTYDKDDGSGGSINVTEDIVYKSYAVKYLTYKNVPVSQKIELSGNVSQASDDVITITDSGKATSIQVFRKDMTSSDEEKLVPSGEYNTSKNASGNTTITIPAGAVPMKHYVTVKYIIKESSSTVNNVTFKSIYGGEAYNGSEIKFEKCKDTLANGSQGKEYIKVTFYKPDSKKFFNAELPFYYKSSDVPTVGQLRDFLKNCELNNVFGIETENDDITMEALYDAVCKNTIGQPGSATSSTRLVLSGGTNGLNPTDIELFTALSGERNDQGYLTKMGAYQVLENYHCDYIYPAGAYADKTVVINGRKQSFHYELALLCAVLTYRTKMTHGFIDVRPNTNTSLVGIQKYVDNLTKLPNLFYMQDQSGADILDSENKRMDIGWYTSVVVGPDPVMLSDTIGTHYGSSAIAYAALVASLKPQSSPLNKALPNVKGMKYKFSNKQMDALVGNRMVCFRLKNEGTTTATSTPYCVDAMTCGGPQCDYRRMTTVSVVTDVVDQIREVADPFIGEPNTIEQRNALSALIDKRLNALYELGEITYYSFEINATIQQVLLGECTIALTLVCPMELRKITTVVSLRAAA